MTWRDSAVEVISKVHADLPEDADLKTRRAALRKAKPYWFADTSWGRKVWAACAREYLEKHGQVRGHGKRKLPLSPLEEMMARADRKST